ncbi:hypothetical protein QQ056_04650 [Oscillatoria laete-virens NRMC-F 0139]|nr:hypothetical protein [Oscillatoria laete-virens]MDL5052852.1 hypothetical protein [Oscillatoria laete-virens NRMC-F 0139]
MEPKRGGLIEPLLEVESGGGQQEVDLITCGAFEPVASEFEPGFEMADDGFDARPEPEFLSQECFSAFGCLSAIVWNQNFSVPDL